MQPPRPPIKDSDLFCTPRNVLDLVEDIAPIAIDPSPGPRGWTHATLELRLEDGNDGLDSDWFALWHETLGEAGLVYCNPPFGRGHLDLWAKKIAHEADRGVEIVALLPATPGPAWCQFLAPRADAICFWRGRLKFLDPRTLKPYLLRDKRTGKDRESSGDTDTALFYFGERAKRFDRAFRCHGWMPRCR